MLAQKLEKGPRNSSDEVDLIQAQGSVNYNHYLSPTCHESFEVHHSLIAQELQLTCPQLKESREGTPNTK